MFGHNAVFIRVKYESTNPLKTICPRWSFYCNVQIMPVLSATYVWGNWIYNCNASFIMTWAWHFKCTFFASVLPQLESYFKHIVLYYINWKTCMFCIRNCKNNEMETRDTRANKVQNTWHVRKWLCDICFCVIFYFVVHYHKINNSGKEEQKVKV